MNYLKTLYEATAMLLLYSNQMKENDYQTVISRYIYDNSHHWEKNPERKYIDVISILLSLERNTVPISKDIFEFLEKTLSSVPDAYLRKHFSESDVNMMLTDIRTAKAVINHYADTADF